MRSDGKHHAGVKVFGSAILRVEPDMASLQFAVSRQAKQPKEAFQETHKAVKTVRSFLTQASVSVQVAASRVTLAQTFEYANGRHQSTGYSANASFHVLLSDLAQIEELLVGVVAAGANQIDAVEYRTTRLKELRAEVRRRAVAAGREKAENYCRAAGITLGEVIGMEDINPNVLRGSGEGHVSQETTSDDSGPDQVFAPESIVVGAAVSLVFAIGATATEATVLT